MPAKKRQETLSERKIRLTEAKQWTQFVALRTKYKKVEEDHSVADRMAEAIINDRIAREETRVSVERLARMSDGKATPWNMLREKAPSIIAYEGDVAAVCFELMGIDPIRILETPEMLDAVPSKGTVNLLEWISESPENKSTFIQQWSRAALKTDETAKERLSDDGTAESLEILRRIRNHLDEDSE